MRFFCCGPKGWSNSTHQLVKIFVEELRREMMFLRNHGWCSTHCFHSHSNLTTLFQSGTKKFFLYREEKVEAEYRDCFDLYITAHLVRQAIAKFFNMHFIKPKMEDNLKPSLFSYGIMEMAAMRSSFWKPFERENKKTPSTITKVFEALLLDYIKDLKPKKMFKKAMADWPAELVSLQIYHKATVSVLEGALTDKIQKFK